jgi:hypothetical protein
MWRSAGRVKCVRAIGVVLVLSGLASTWLLLDFYK